MKIDYSEDIMENKEKEISTVIFKPIAETEKCFLDEKIGTKALHNKASMLRGERFSFQLAYQDMKMRFDRRIGHIKVCHTVGIER